MKLGQAYRTLKTYSERNITGKDCSNLNLDEAIDFTVKFLAHLVDIQSELFWYENSKTLDEDQKQENSK